MGDALTNWLARPAERSGTCIERIVRTVDNGRSQRVKCDLAVQGVIEELFNILPLCPHGIFPPVRADPLYHAHSIGYFIQLCPLCRAMFPIFSVNSDLFCAYAK